ncbi:MAG: HD domain-containing protein [Candidatus Gracilibacteria bacterium]|nr:HD domain-containing protein [Candidatus Gracilibacteria bacterium]
MIKNLEHKLRFIELLDKMKDIKRIILLRNGGLESDAEHSYHLAMMVLVLAEDFPELNIEKCLKFALVHDLVEIYAGDTEALNTEQENTKKQREEDALIELEKQYFQVIPEIINLIKEYELRESKEARFVYSLDKVQPIMQVVIEGGNAWHKYKIDFEKIKARQYSKIYPEFGLGKILDKYFGEAKEKNIYYKEENE